MKQDKRITIRLTPGLMDSLELGAHKMKVKTAEYARQILKKAIIEEGKFKPAAAEPFNPEALKLTLKAAIKECLAEHNTSDRRQVETSANIETFILLRKFLAKEDSSLVDDGHKTAGEFLEQVGITPN